MLCDILREKADDGVCEPRGYEEEVVPSIYNYTASKLLDRI
jgi:hypothetical protein